MPSSQSCRSSQSPVTAKRNHTPLLSTGSSSSVQCAARAYIPISSGGNSRRPSEPTAPTSSPFKRKTAPRPGWPMRQLAGSSTASICAGPSAESKYSNRAGEIISARSSPRSGSVDCVNSSSTEELLSAPRGSAWHAATRTARDKMNHLVQGDISTPFSAIPATPRQFVRRPDRELAKSSPRAVSRASRSRPTTRRQG